MKYFKLTLIIISILFFASCGNNENDKKNEKKDTLTEKVSFNEENIEIEIPFGFLSGTLLVPKVEKDKIPVVLLIAGSGPTDRNGNNQYMKNNSLKMLAEALYKNNIATLRYDKRGIGKSKMKNLEESKLRFEDYINDASAFIKYLKKDKRFSEIIVAGHSEGSLIGMVAARYATPGKYISLNGAGRSADIILKEQIGKEPTIKDVAYVIIDSLVAGETVNEIPPVLNALFRKSVQPYIISWFKYDPQKEIVKLDIPILIIQGKTDIQVAETDANLLKKAKPEADIKFIEGMNHIFKNVEKDRAKNIETYSKPDLPINKEFVKTITDFIKK